jgi:hypothetical protein
MLTDWNQPEYNYEAVRKQIDLALALDIDDKELDVLKQMVEICAHWKSLARKIINSRQLAKLEYAVFVANQGQPNVVEVVSKAFLLTMKHDSVLN